MNTIPNKNYFFIIIITFFHSCLKSDCKLLSEMNKDNECIAILTEDATYSSTPIKNGINPFTKEKCDCKENDRWIRVYSSEMEIGDTIIKRKGELKLSIHKKDTIITYKFKCENKIYE